MIPLLKNIELSSLLPSDKAELKIVKDQFNFLFEIIKPYIDGQAFIEDFNQALELYPENQESAEFEKQIYKELERY
ncbi:MAG: hypothetical protein GY909_01035 [Oligoflexia bacterium]|nr:hypothetical protein [Oligoflexia bacterium]